MAEERFQLQNTGQEVQKDDVNLLGKVSGLADDRVFAELLRIAPFDGSNVAKAIMPFSNPSATAATSATVITTASANGSIKVNPFRAIVGPRTALANGVEKDNWRDIRTGLWVSDTPGQLGKTIQLAANASGNPRWDLIYAAIAVDQNTQNVTRKVKNPAGTTVTPTPTFRAIEQLVSIPTPVQGTPAASPALPATPSDAGGTYNIPLAYVRVPNGFSSGSTIDPRDIMLAENVLVYSRAHGISNVRPANHNYKPQGTALTTARIGTWGSGGARPRWFLPPGLTGSQTLLIALDLDNASSANWSHQHLSVVDDSRDWSNHFFRWQAHANAEGYPWDRTGAFSGTPGMFMVDIFGTSFGLGAGQSFFNDNAVAANTSTVARVDSTVIPGLGSAVVTLYCDKGDAGKMKVAITNTPSRYVFVFLEAFGPFPSY